MRNLFSKLCRAEIRPKSTAQGETLEVWTNYWVVLNQTPSCLTWVTLCWPWGSQRPPHIYNAIPNTRGIGNMGRRIRRIVRARDASPMNSQQYGHLNKAHVITPDMPTWLGKFHKAPPLNESQANSGCWERENRFSRGKHTDRLSQEVSPKRVYKRATLNGLGRVCVCTCNYN